MIDRHVVDSARTRLAQPVAVVMVAVAVTAASVGCGPDEPVRVVTGVSDPITVTVRRPPDWPDDAYAAAIAEVIVSWDDHEERTPLTGTDTVIELPSAGTYSIRAEAEADGCADTAAVGGGGTSRVALAGGEVVLLSDSGEICE